MAEVVTYEAKEGFNTIFNIIENCNIETPAFDQGFTSGKFFFKKREGLTETAPIGEDIKRLAVYEDPTQRKKLALTFEYFKVFSTGGEVTNLTSVSEDTVLSQGDLYVPGGGAEESGTMTGAANVSGAANAYFEDSSASWTENEHVGKYVWVFSGTGAGQIRSIKSNTATRAYIDEGWINIVSPTSGSGYRVYPFLAQTGLISSQSGNVVKFYDGDSVSAIDTLEPFVLAEEFDGRMWYVKSSNKNILFYTEIGQPFLIESFIDTGLDDIIGLKSFGEYLLIGKQNKIRIVRSEISSDDSIFYNVKDLVSGTGIKSDRAMDVWKGKAYFVGNDNRIYSLGISINDKDVIGDIGDISNVFGGYIENFDFDEAIFLKKPQELHIILIEEQGHITRVFKYYNKFSGWVVDTFPHQFIDVRYLNDTYYYAINTGVYLNAGDDDIGEKIVQRVGVLHGIQTLLQYKRVTQVSAILKYDGENVTNIKISATGNFLNSTAQKNIDDTTLTDTGVSSETPSLGENPIGSSQIGGVFDITDFFAHTRVVTKRFVETANFFQIVFSDDFGTGFHIGDIQVIQTTLNNRIASKNFGR